MARHRFGEGQYRYFDVPLPDAVAELRAAFWPHLLPVAREWAERRGRRPRGPTRSRTGSTSVTPAGQARPTPLMLRYGPGDWNALHRDLYGELVFPLQVVLGLDRAGRRLHAVASSSWSSSAPAPSRGPPPPRSPGATGLCSPRPTDRCERSGAGPAAPMRHGVSVVRSGQRRTLGLVFHGAQ